MNNKRIERVKAMDHQIVTWSMVDREIELFMKRRVFELSSKKPKIVAVKKTNEQTPLLAVYQQSKLD